MPDIDRTVDIKVAAGRGPVTAEIPLAGHASGHWRELFGELASKRRQDRGAKAEERGPHLGHRPVAGLQRGPASRVGAGCRKCFDQRGQWHGAAVSVRCRPDRGRYPRLVGSSSAVAASPPLVLTRCLEGLFAQRVSLPVRRWADVAHCPGVTVSSRQ